VIEKVKKANPQMTIGCDLIVGFPGEKDDDFELSLDIINSGLIDYAHIFSYSDRPGTPASQLPGKLPPPTIKKRHLMAREAVRQARIRHLDRQIGRVLSVISEGVLKGDGAYRGISDNYLRVKLPPDHGGKRDIINVRATACGSDYIIGDVISH
jgi:threonylcarbamoyladenosine tRNA methylthiotransferase MtaB